MRAAARLAALGLAPALCAGCMTVESQLTGSASGNLFAGVATAVMRPMEMVRDVALVAGEFQRVKGHWPTSQQELRFFWDEMGEPRPPVRWASFSKLDFRTLEDGSLEIGFAVGHETFATPGGGRGSVSGSSGKMILRPAGAAPAPAAGSAVEPAAPR